MDIREIVEKYRNGDYSHNVRCGIKLSSDHVFDEGLTVKRNREMVKEYNDKIDAEKKEAYAKQAELNKKLAEDVTCYITENYSVNSQVARKIERFCYEHWHYDTYDYLSQIDTIADFIESILNEERAK